MSTKFPAPRYSLFGRVRKSSAMVRLFQRNSAGLLIAGLLSNSLLCEKVVAQSFFGIPLFEKDSIEDLESAEVEQPKPLEEWPLKLSVTWEEYKQERAKGFSKINKLYVPNLKTIREHYAQDDRLEDAVLVAREIERVEGEIDALDTMSLLPPIHPRAGSGTLPKEAEDAYREQLSLKSRGLRLLNKKYTTQIAELKTKFIGINELDGALAAKRIVEELEKEGDALEALDANLGKGDLVSEQFENLSEAPDVSTPKGLRDHLLSNSWIFTGDSGPQISFHRNGTYATRKISSEWEIDSNLNLLLRRENKKETRLVYDERNDEFVGPGFSDLEKEVKVVRDKK